MELSWRYKDALVDNVVIFMFIVMNYCTVGLSEHVLDIVNTSRSNWYNWSRLTGVHCSIMVQNDGKQK